MSQIPPPTPNGDDMTPAVLDDARVDALLAGLAPAEAPAGYGAVAVVLTQLQAPATADELADEDAALAAFRAARNGGAVVTPITRAPSAMVAPVPVPANGVSSSEQTERRPHRTRRVLVASLAAAFVLVVGGSAVAASNGSLPGPVQDFAHDALDVVGVHVPTSDGDSGTPASDTGNGSKGPGATDATDGRGGATVTTGKANGNSAGHSTGNSTGSDPTTPANPGGGADNPNAGGTASGNANAGAGNNNAGGNGNGNAGGNAGGNNPNAGGNNPNAGSGNSNGSSNGGGNAGGNNPNAGSGNNNAGGNGNGNGNGK